MFRQKAKLSRRQMLAAIPRKNPAVRWTELDTGLIRVTYAKAGGRLTRLARRVFAIPEMAELALDETGAKVIRQMDGGKSVGELIAYVSAELKLGRKESEVAFLKYLDLLGRRNLVGLEVRPVDKDP